MRQALRMTILVGNIVCTMAAAGSARAAAFQGQLWWRIPARSSVSHHGLRLMRSPSTVNMEAKYVRTMISQRPGAPQRPARSEVTRRDLSPDIGGAVAVAVAASVWLKIWTTLAAAGRVSSKISRKAIHCGSGPLFLLCWPFFSAQPSARYIAAAVPLLQAFALIIAGLSKDKKPTGPSAQAPEGASSQTEAKPKGLVAAISRSGNPIEVLRGPFIYVLVLLVATVACWRDSLIGVVAISQMAAGDGMADIIGRRYGTKKWFFSKEKSYAGSLAFVVAGFLVNIGLVGWFHYWGLTSSTMAAAAFPVLTISVLCAIVELVPIWDDNVTVPVAAALLATLFFSEPVRAALTETFLLMQ